MVEDCISPPDFICQEVASKSNLRLYDSHRFVKTMIMVSEVQNTPVVAIPELSLDWDFVRRAADGGRCQDLRA